jgi:hypothetical protein
MKPYNLEKVFHAESNPFLLPGAAYQQAQDYKRCFSYHTLSKHRERLPNSDYNGFGGF